MRMMRSTIASVSLCPVRCRHKLTNTSCSHSQQRAAAVDRLEEIHAHVNEIVVSRTTVIVAAASAE